MREASRLIRASAGGARGSGPSGVRAMMSVGAEEVMRERAGRRVDINISARGAPALVARPAQRRARLASGDPRARPRASLSAPAPEARHDPPPLRPMGSPPHPPPRPHRSVSPPVTVEPLTASPVTLPVR